MKQFSEFNIQVSLPTLVGDKIKMVRILNKEIIVHAFLIKPSKINIGKDYMELQISVKDTKHVVFTQSYSLMEMIKKVKTEDFPFTTTIEKKDERYQFT